MPNSVKAYSSAIMLALMAGACTTQSGIAPPPPPAPVNLAEPEAPKCEGRSFSVYFARDSYMLDEIARAAVDEIMAGKLDCSDHMVTIEGHADSVGASDINLAISKKRAEAVYNALLAKGLSAEEIEILALGETEAVNDAGMAVPMNRRVVVHFKELKEQPNS